MAHWWQDPATESRLAAVNVNVTFFLLGIYGWEYFQTLCVEYAVIRGRLPLRWPLVPYIVGRICLLSALLLLSIGMSSMLGYFACQPGITCTTIPMDIAIGTCSTNLMIRTWVIWKNSRLVHIFLLLLALGHWSILVLDIVNVKANLSNGICVVHLDHPELTAGVFMYTTCYDLFVLVLSIVKLSKQRSTSPLRDRLYAQGIFYFAVAAIANVLPTVFAFLDADDIVSITGNFAITASTIVSCRVVRSLYGLRVSLPSNSFDENVERDACVLTTQLPSQSSIISACT